MSNVEKLAERQRELGVTAQHVSWTLAGTELTEEEQAAEILRIMDDVAAQAANTVAVPVSQMQEIYQALKALTRLGQATVEEWNSMSDSEATLRRQVFNLAEGAVMFAGNWVDKR